MFTIGNLILSAQVCILVMAAVHAWRAFRQSKATETVALFKATEDGESITASLTFFKGETTEQKTNRINEVFSIGESRREYNDARFKAHLEQERAKQANEAKLKSV